MLEIHSPLDYLRYLLTGVRAALSLDPQLYRLVFEYPGSLSGIPFWVVFGAGVSRMLGQSMVLFANRVNKLRFVFSILLGAFRFSLDVLLTAGTYWLLANWIGVQDWQFLQTVRAIALAFAPYWLGVLVLIPYLGEIIAHGLKLWVFLALVVASRAVFGLVFFEAVLAALLVYAFVWGVDLAAGRLLTQFAGWLVVKAAGIPERKSLDDLYAEFTPPRSAD